VQGEHKLCVDGETLAAWADGGLRPAEAATVEQHLSECDRCTALLATFVRTSPAAPQVESLWHRWRLSWLVPLATAATAAALWVAVPRNPTPPLAVADNDAVQENAAVRENAAVQENSVPAPAQPSAAADARKKAAAPSAPIGALAKREEAPQVESRVGRADESQQARAREVAEPTVTLEAPARLQEADQKAADAQTTGRLAAAAPAAAATPSAAAVPSARATPTERNEQAFAVRQALVAPTEILSPNPANRWRIVAGGRVERSTTGGARWEPANVPAPATLTAGASPAPSVCWLIGRAGLVYLTTDGLRFTRVPFPESTDLASVQATDDRRATVRSTDGRTFRTEDQGATWTTTTR